MTEKNAKVEEREEPEQRPKKPPGFRKSQKLLKQVVRATPSKELNSETSREE